MLTKQSVLHGWTQTHESAVRSLGAYLLSWLRAVLVSSHQDAIKDDPYLVDEDHDLIGYVTCQCGTGAEVCDEVCTYCGMWPDPPTHLHLSTSALMYKTGFDDGRLLYPFVYDRPCELDGGRRLLIAVVRRWILPKLEHDVVLRETNWGRNPIMIQSVDGIDLKELGYDFDLTPAYVAVPVLAILKLADEMGVGARALESPGAL